MGGHTALRSAQPPLRDAQTRQELIDGEGFGQIVVGTRVEGFDLVLVFASCADHDDRRGRPGADLADQVDTVHIRKPQVEKDDIRVMGSDLQQGIGGSRRCQVAIVVNVKCCGHQVLDQFVVFHNKDHEFIHAASPPSRAE